MKMIKMISQENIDNIKEVLYTHCKGKQSFKIGGLMKLRQLIDSVLSDSSKTKFRVLEACHYLSNQNYIEIKNKSKYVFSIGTHFITAKLWQEMNIKESEDEQIKLW